MPLAYTETIFLDLLCATGWDDGPRPLYAVLCGGLSVSTVYTSKSPIRRSSLINSYRPSVRPSLRIHINVGLAELQFLGVVSHCYLAMATYGSQYMPTVAYVNVWSYCNISGVSRSKKSLLPRRGCYYRLNQNSRLKRSAYSQRVTVCEPCPTYWMSSLQSVCHRFFKASFLKGLFESTGWG